MFWLFILVLSITLAWSLLPEKDSQWSVLDEKPEPIEEPTSKPPDVKYLGEYDRNKR